MGLKFRTKDSFNSTWRAELLCICFFHFNLHRFMLLIVTSSSLTEAFVHTDLGLILDELILSQTFQWIKPSCLRIIHLKEDIVKQSTWFPVFLAFFISLVKPTQLIILITA